MDHTNFMMPEDVLTVMEKVYVILSSKVLLKKAVSIIFL